MDCERCAYLEAELHQTEEDLKFVQDRSKTMIEDLRSKLSACKTKLWKLKKEKDQGKLFNQTQRRQYEESSSSSDVVSSNWSGETD